MLSILRQNAQYNPKNLSTPYMVIDRNIITDNFLKIKNILAGIKVFYAVKANSHLTILEHLHGLGGGFEIASTQELDDAIGVGANPEKIISSNTLKTPDFIKAAYGVGVRYFAFDSRMEVDKLSALAPGCKGYLRIAVDNSKSEWPLSKKFGAIPGEALSLLEYARQSKVIPYGITFHVGSQCLDDISWELAINQVYEIFQKAKKKNIILKMINIGGGLPIQYLKKIPALEDIGHSISRSLEKKFNRENIEIGIEPGRSIVGDSGNIVSRIILKSERGSEKWIYLDIGVFNGLMETIEGIKYKILSDRHLSVNMKNIKKTAYTIAGPSCDSVDTMYKNYLLPKDLRLGDILYFVNTAAYTTSYASNFNGFPVPKIYFI